ncbi:hypothetical protein HRbin40_02375 [bacterium HR40]|nr:hypothetical protein HRbin40_02375 [bacterium HR40]
MRLDDGSELTYCTNIHRGETLPEVRAMLAHSLPAIRQRVAPGQPFGLGLWLPAAVAEELAAPATFEAFADLLAELHAYVFTLNGFPYGRFHGTRVKEQVYEPDWSRPERLCYTQRLAELLVRFLPEEGYGSISTVPGTFRPLANEPSRVEAIVFHLRQAAAHLVDLERRTGRVLALAVEPEPACMFETTREFVRFVEDRLLVREGLSAFAQLADLSRAQAEEALRRHLGICFDVCHAAVAFEDVEESLALLAERAIAVAKLQLSAALVLRPVGRDADELLRPFADPVYLHQVVARRPGGEFAHYHDLPEALAALAAGEPAEEWRIHCHVPIFLEELEGPLATTREVLARLLARHRRSPVSRHLEVETYTFAVLPRSLQRMAVEEAIARELLWVREQLGGSA